MSELKKNYDLLALIPARGGSKGIPKKNIKILGGKPLLAHSIEFARNIPDIERIIVSTDNEEIAEIAIKYGAEVPFLRPAELADDAAPMYQTVKHTLEFLKEQGFDYEYLALLQPTSPFRLRSDFKIALNQILNDKDIDSVVSLDRLPNHLSPDFLMQIADGMIKPFMGTKVPVSRRQDVTPAFIRNGQFYLSKVSSISEEKSIYGNRSVPLITSHEAVNLDTMEDWKVAVKLMKSWES